MATTKKSSLTKKAGRPKKASGTKKKSSAAKKYGDAASKSVEREMKAMQQGKLRSGGDGSKVTNPKQAIAIGLSEARRAGAKVPVKKAGKKEKVSGQHGRLRGDRP